MTHTALTRRAAALSGLSILAATMLALTSCAGTGNAAGPSDSAAPAELTPVNFRLGFIAGGWDVGEYVALANGYYEDAGLDVSIAEGEGSSSNVQLLSSGQIDIAKIGAAALVPAVAEGAELKMVASHLQAQGSGVATTKDITSVEDMNGKTYAGIAHDFTTAYFPAYVEAAGLTDVKTTMVAPDAVPQVLVAGQTDMMVANAWAQVVQLDVIGAEYNFFPYADYDLDPLGVGYVASDAYISENEDVVKRFVEASLKGWQFVYDNPDEAAEIFLSEVPSANPEAAKLTAEMMGDYSHTAASEGKPLGWIAEEDVQRTIDLSVEYGLAKSAVEPDQIYTNVVAE